MLRIEFKDNQWQAARSPSSPLAETIRSGLMKGIDQGLPALAEDLAYKLGRVRVQDVLQVLARGEDWQRTIETAAAAIALPDIVWQLMDLDKTGKRPASPKARGTIGVLRQRAAAQLGVDLPGTARKRRRG
jgi:hypothetical protein